MSRPTTFGVIVGSRGFFNAQLAVGDRQRIEAKLTKLGFQYVIPPVEATKNGVIETLADAKVCAELFEQHRKTIDGVLVLLPNFGDEVGVIETLTRAGLNVPVMVQAADDQPGRLDLANRRDSFCGKISVTCNLYQAGIPFTDTTYHTVDIDSDVFTSDLAYFARVCRVVKAMRTARIGAIGARPGAFRTMRYSEKLLQSAGITVQTVDMSEIIGTAQKMRDDDPRVKAEAAAVTGYGNLEAGVVPEAIVRQAKLGLAMKDWIAENEIDACGVQCWTSIEQHYGCALCVTMSMLGEAGIPAACEVDLGNAISMLALKEASGNIPAVLDWNNNYGDDRDMCINTHCSNFPKSFIGATPTVGALDVLGASLGRDNCFGAVKGNVVAGPMTFAKVTTDDVMGMVKSYVGEGDFTDDPHNCQGGIAVCRVDNLQTMLKYIGQAGYEHHVSMVRTHCADVIEEAFEKYLGWSVYRHQ